MLTTSQMNPIMEENNISTYLLIPFDSVKNPDEFAQLSVLPDGTLYVINQKVENKQELLPLKNEIVEDGSDVISAQKQAPSSDNQLIKKLGNKNVKQILPSPSEVKYNCSKCNNSFKSVKEYKDHLKWHKSQKKFNCPNCATGYNIENNLTIHNVLVHSNDNDLSSCPICGISLKFQRAASLKSHLMIHLVEELHICDVCQAEIEKEEDYAQHMLTHASKNKDYQSLKCLHCDIEFKTRQELKLHISDHTKAWRYFRKKKGRKPTIEKKFNCEKCDKSFIKQSLLERHDRIHSGEKPFKCMICDQCFTQKGTLQIHMLKHSGKKPFACTLCPARFNQKGNLRVHINKTHTAPDGGQKSFKCPHCSCIFKRIASLNGHVTKAHVRDTLGDENIIGNVMQNLQHLQEQSFDSYVTLTESAPDGTEKKIVVQMKKVGDMRLYKCSYCPKTCKKPSDLIRHIRVHTRERPFMCKICRKSFSIKFSLMVHIKTHSNERNVKCKSCDLVFGSKKLLNIHLSKHDNEKLSKWQCTTCGALFDEFEKALQHKMAQDQPHTIQSVINKVMKQPLYQTVYGNLTFKPPRPKIPNTGSELSVLRPYPCTVCDARFTTKINLRRHVKNHENDRRFKCQMCPKAFITSYRLKEHVNFHNNIKNYACKTCGKRFGTSTNLRRHMITHSNQRPYMCPYCSKHFQTLELSRRHIKRVHKNDVLPKIESDAENLKFTTNILNEATSVIISNKVAIEGSNLQNYQSETLQKPTPQLNSNPLQDPNATLQTIYVNLEDLQLISNPDLNLTTLVDNGPQETFETKSQILPIFDGNVVVQSPHDLNPTQNIFDAVVQTSSVSNEVRNIYDTSTESNEDSTIYDVVGPPTATSNEARTIYDDANIICMNCNGMFLCFVDFQKHQCRDDKKRSLEPAQTALETEKEEQLPKAKALQLPKAKALQCPVCEKSFKKRISYRNHMRTHSSNQCPRCNLNFNNKLDYLEHIETHGVDDVGNLYQCMFCLKSFKKPSDLNRHIRTHTGEKPFGCVICDKKFALKSTLKCHVKTHNPNNKQFGCEVCNTFYSSKSSLKVHMTIHTGQTPYSCSICGAKFRTLGCKKSHENSEHRRTPKKKAKKTLTDNLSNLLSNMEMNKLDQLTDSVNVPLESLGLTMDENNLPVSSHTLDLPSQIVNLEVPHPDSILATIPEDPSNLLQQLQMVLRTNEVETEAVPSLVLDDVGFLDLNSSANNFQIVSLPEEGGGVTISIREDQNQVNAGKEKTKPFECDSCLRTYASKDGLRKHKKNVHGGGEKKKVVKEKTIFECERCEGKFDSKEKLIRHDKKEHQCLCTLCDIKFNEINSYIDHMERFHSEKEQNTALLNLKLDLASATMEPLFSSLFSLKKI